VGKDTFQAAVWWGKAGAQGRWAGNVGLLLVILDGVVQRVAPGVWWDQAGVRIVLEFFS
jgi:hypothetical protein